MSKKTISFLSFIFIFTILFSSDINAEKAEEKYILDSRSSSTIFEELIIEPFRLELDKPFDKEYSWSIGKYFDLYSGEDYINVYLENNGSSTYTYAISNSPFFTYPIASTTLSPGKKVTVKVDPKKVPNLDKTGNGDYNYRIFIKVTNTSGSGRVIGRCRIAGR